MFVENIKSIYIFGNGDDSHNEIEFASISCLMFYFSVDSSYFAFHCVFVCLCFFTILLPIAAVNECMCKKAVVYVCHMVLFHNKNAIFFYCLFSLRIPPFSRQIIDTYSFCMCAVAKYDEKL